MNFHQENLAVSEMKLASALKMRKIHINQEINENSVFEVIYLLQKLVKIDQISGTKKPIELIINSPGGESYAGLSLISKIEELKDLGYEIITTVGGHAMSMGFMILLVGSTRQAYRYATLMIHQPWSWIADNLKGMQENLEEVSRLWDLMKEIIMENSDITNEQLDELYKCKKDWYLTPKQACKAGLIDVIL